MAAVTWFVSLFVLLSPGVFGQKTFKPFNATDLEKYRNANEAEKSDLKIHVAAPKVPKEDLAKIEELCLKRLVVLNTLELLRCELTIVSSSFCNSA